MMDIAFSVDSILAAFAISDKVWVLLVGGMLGILMMRTVAGLFLALIEKVPELENTAFILIGIISAKMFAGVFRIPLIALCILRNFNYCVCTYIYHPLCE